MKNESNNNDCEINQLSMSDKLDASTSLNHSEKDHLAGCSDCQNFYHFIHGHSFQQIAHAPAYESFGIEEVSQVSTIMEILANEKPATVKKSNMLWLSIATAATAAIAAVSISEVIQPTETVSDSETIAQTEAPSKGKLNLPSLSIPEINLDEKYSVINTVVVNRMASVSFGISKLKGYFIEGNAFLDEHTQGEAQGVPESYYSSHSDSDRLS